jgi:hypothetical protein
MIGMSLIYIVSMYTISITGIRWVLNDIYVYILGIGRALDERDTPYIIGIVRTLDEPYSNM